MCILIDCYYIYGHVLIRLKDKVQQGKIPKDSIITVSVDRDDDNTYPQAITIDALPTLTTHNRYLFVMSVQDVIGEPWLTQFCKLF